jgi:hypothetical protein
LCIRHCAPVAERGGGARYRAIEFAVSVPGAIRASARDFQRQPIIQRPRNRAACNGDAYKRPIDKQPYAELVAYGRFVVPVVIPHKLLRLLE